MKVILVLHPHVVSISQEEVWKVIPGQFPLSFYYSFLNRYNSLIKLFPSKYLLA